jgi:predicted transposase YdaD
MAAAVEALEPLSQDPEAQRMAREREDSIKFYQMSLDRREESGIAKGREQGIVEGREQGISEGVRLNQADTIAKLCEACGVEITPARQAELDDPRTDLDAIVSALIAERRWP